MPSEVVSENQQQYGDSRNLSIRYGLHEKYSSIDRFSWVTDHLVLIQGGPILDVGCGPGWFWEKMSDRLPAALDLILTDLSHGMVKEAHDRLRRIARYGSVLAVQAEATHLPFSDQHFSSVFAMHMLYHVSNPEIAITEMARVLRPEGQLIVTTNGKQNFSSVHTLRARSIGGAPCDPVVSKFDLDEARRLLSKQFHEIQVSTLQDVYKVSEPEDVFAYLVSMPPEEKIDDYQQRTLRRSIEVEFAREGGIMHIPVETGVIVASRSRI